MRFEEDILIVDDEIPNLRLLAEMLEKEGYRVRPAETAQLAIDSALAKPPSLILLDVRMPGIDGFEVCRRLKEDERTRDVPIIFVSALQEVDDKVRGFEAGGVDFITKPYQELEILARVRTHTRLHNLHVDMERIVAARTSELRESEERFRATFEQAAVGIAHVSPEGRFLRVNRKICDIVGYPLDEMLALTFQDITHPDDVESDLDQVQRLLRGEADSYSKEKRYLRSDGTTVWANLNVTLVRDGAGAPRWFVSVVVDISRRKHEEEQRLKVEARFRAVMEYSSLAIVLLSPDGRILQVNTAWKRLWGYDERQTAEVLATYNLLTDKQTIDLGVGPLIRKAFAGEPVVLPPVEYSNRRLADDLGLDLEDRTLWIQVHMAPVVGANQEVQFIVLTYVDITELIRAQDALKESEADLLRAQEVGHIGSWRLDLLGDNLIWTDEVYRLFGVAKGTPMTYARFLEHVHPEDRDYVDGEWRAGIGGKPYDIEHRLLVDDEVRWVREKAELVFDDEGTATVAIGIVQDITDRKRAEQEARRHQEALARIDRATSLGQLTGSIAHELNQPLTGILSNAQAAEMLIKSGQWEVDEMAEIMAEIVADTKRGGEVIHNLRELFREQKVEFHPLDINVLVDETIQLLRSELVIHHVALTTDCATSMPLVDGNRIQIQQVLVNLIMNSIQAMDGIAPVDRRLQIATAQDAKEVTVWVEDCGPGIDADKIDRIFEPLATWKPGGTGIGLAISNSIVESHGGRMWVENRPEGGARVGFALPVLKTDLHT